MKRDVRLWGSLAVSYRVLAKQLDAALGTEHEALKALRLSWKAAASELRPQGANLQPGPAETSADAGVDGDGGEHDDPER